MNDPTIARAAIQTASDELLRANDAGFDQYRKGKHIDRATAAIAAAAAELGFALIYRDPDDGKIYDAAKHTEVAVTLINAEAA